MSDRAFRDAVICTEPDRRSGQFVISEASEVMAVLAWATDQADLRQALGRILVGLTASGQLAKAEALGCVGSTAVLLKDAFLPNLLQTLEGTPAFVHAGPFGNIAHGNCSIVSDRLALRCAEYVVTEAGFGSDLEAEKFFSTKCRTSSLRPECRDGGGDASGS